MNEEEKRRTSRTRVRVLSTYTALIWIFAVSTAMIFGFAFWEIPENMLDHMRDVFFTVLPVATGIVTYWFASRGRSRDDVPNGGEDAYQGEGDDRNADN